MWNQGAGGKRRRMRGRNESRRGSHNWERRALRIRGQEMKTSLTNLKSRRTQRHGRGRSIKRRGIKGLGLQWNINLKTIGGKRIMMGNIRTKRAKSSLTQTKAAGFSTTIWESDGEGGRQRGKR